MLSHLANSLVRFGRGARCLRPCDGLHDRTSPEAAAVSGDAPPVRRSAPWTRQQHARSGCALQGRPGTPSVWHELKPSA